MTSWGVELNEEANLLTVQDVQELCGVGRATVRYWADMGVIPFTTTRRGVRIFDRADVEAFRRERQARLARGIRQVVPA